MWFTNPLLKPMHQSPSIERYLKSFFKRSDFQTLVTFSFLENTFLRPKMNGRPLINP
jgi:hypothetical protein